MKIADLISKCQVAFGTSGARGLSDNITDYVAYAYTTAFLSYLEDSILNLNKAQDNQKFLAVAGDLRPSTGRIKNAVFTAALARGYQVIDCGLIPSPALAYYGFSKKIPTIMVTGSHIPADRNGIKFTKADGEISKIDEQRILNVAIDMPCEMDGQAFQFDIIEQCPKLNLPVSKEALTLYINRYLDAFPASLLQGKRIGVYEHSAVGRDVMGEIVAGLGGEVISLGRSETFIPVDTEAIRPEDWQLAKKWAVEKKLDAILSTDGDSDRPLIADETGKWFRRDIVGIFTAQFLEADAVVLPVSCNSAVDEIGFQKIVRSKIGSPYVIQAMQELAIQGYKRIVGYEANGGFLQNSALPLEAGTLDSLPTRDPIIVQLSVLSLAKKLEIPLSGLRTLLPARYTASDRLKNFPVLSSKSIIEQLSKNQAVTDKIPCLEELFLDICGGIKSVSEIDGLRITYLNNEVIHLRPSGNAPEFRCYTEAATEERAEAILRAVLEIMNSWR